MKNTNKKISILIFSLYLSTALFPIEATAADAGTITSSNTILISENTELNQQVAPFADIIDWRYKSENGKVYRRQYNYSQQKWIGEWELC